jgi:hypothetical protein
MIYPNPFPHVSMWFVVDDATKIVQDTKLGDKISNDNPR